MIPCLLKITTKLFFRVFFRVAADGVDLGQINMELFDEVKDPYSAVFNISSSFKGTQA
jgi:hypothetical protein